MKTIEILEWICNESVNGEYLNIVDIPKEGDEEWEQNEEWWDGTFGACPPHSIPAGRYLYFYSSQVDAFFDDPDAQIEIPNTGTMFDYDYINLYKLED